MDVWGLTGNIACGKSLVEECLRERGVPVIDMDRLAREVVEPGEPALLQIREVFGDRVLTDGRLDREALGRIVFSDPVARRKLEEITWPRIFARTRELLRNLRLAGEVAAVVSAALMVEADHHDAWDGLAVVTCPADVQLERLLARDGGDLQRAKARIESQLPQERKVAMADVVIDNGGGREQTARQVERWVEERLRS